MAATNTGHEKPETFDGIRITGLRKVPNSSTLTNSESTQRPSRRTSHKPKDEQIGEEEEEEDGDDEFYNGDERASDGDYDERRKKRREKEEANYMKRMSFITDAKWKPTPNFKKDLPRNEYWNMILLRDREIKRLKETVKRKNKTLREMRDGKVKNLNRKLGNKTEELEAIELAKEDMKKQIQELKHQLEQSDIKASEQEAAISTLTAERLDLFDKGDMPYLPDDVVSASLAELFQMTRDWVYRWVLQDFSLVDTEQAKAIGARLYEGTPQEFASKDIVSAIEKGQVSPRIILQALVNGILSRRTFMRPFDLLNAESGGDCMKQGLDRLQVSYNYLKKACPAAAQRFRALALRAYAPSDEEGVQFGELAGPPCLNNLVASNSQSILQAVLHVTSGLLAAKNGLEHMEREAEILKITKSFIRASVLLNAEYPWLEFRFRGQLKDIGFSMDHSLFIGHRGLKLKEEAAPVRPDAREAGIEGKQIDLVVEPAVLRHGFKNGGNYDKYRILLQASVWMVKPEDLKAKSTIGTAFNTKAEKHCTTPAVSISSMAPDIDNVNPLTVSEPYSPSFKQVNLSTSPVSNANTPPAKIPSLLLSPVEPAKADASQASTNATVSSKLVAEITGIVPASAPDSPNKKRPSELEESFASKKARATPSYGWMHGATVTEGGMRVYQLHPGGADNRQEQMHNDLGYRFASISTEDRATTTAAEGYSPGQSPVTPPLNGLR